MILLALILSLPLFLEPGGTPPSHPLQTETRATADNPVVLRIGDDAVHSREFEDWMLRTYGERRAPLFGELLLLREIHGTRPLEEYRDQVLEEFDVRVAGAFKGDRAAFLEELETFGRSYEGRLAERMLELEYEELSLKIESLRDFRTALEVDILPPLLPAGIGVPITDELDLARIRLRDRELVLRRKAFATWMRRAFGEKLVERFVQDYLARKFARAKKIKLTQAEVLAQTERDIETLIADFHDGDREAWLKEITKAGRTEATFRHEYILRMQTQLLVERLIRAERTITPEQVRRGWEDQYGPGGVRHEIRWLRVDAVLALSDDGKTRSSDELQELLNEALDAAALEVAQLRERIENGEDFATLVEKHSDDSYTRPTGGRPSDDFQIRQLNASFQAPVLALEPGELSEPLTQGTSVYLFEKLAVRRTPLEKAEEKVRAKLMARRPDEIEVARRKNLLRQSVEVTVEPELFR